MQDTSIEAFIQINEDGTIGKRQAQVYEVLKMGPKTNREISLYLHLPINSVTPRVFELREKGLVRRSGSKIDNITRKRAIIWEVKNEILDLV
jgi:DNA-binding MarR family transcriptional regulator